MNKVIMAIDAGGTHTRIALIDEGKNIINRLVVGSGSLAVTPHAIENICQGIDELWNQEYQNYQIIAIIAGISAFMIIKDKEGLKKELENKYQIPVFLEGDAIFALYSILQDQHNQGVLVLAGTGTAILAINEENTFMTSGWGHFLTERGSAYGCVRDFICRMIRCYESSGYISDLGKQLMMHFDLDDINSFRMLIYHHSKDYIAKSARFFNQKALNGDQEAIAWLEENGHYLAQDVLNAMFHTKLAKEIIIGFRGGFVSNNQFVKKGIIDFLQQNNVAVQEVLGDQDPIFGCYYYALKKGILC